MEQSRGGTLISREWSHYLSGAQPLLRCVVCEQSTIDVAFSASTVIYFRENYYFPFVHGMEIEI